MKTNISSFLVGIIFSMGLAISGMTKTSKVIGFLDIFGQWDPSLMFVMMGAIAVHLVAYKIVRKKMTPLFAKQWYVPDKKQITPALIIGSALFGIGWGIGGFCPGPAVTSLASFQTSAYVFVASMLVGMLLFRVLDSKFKFRK